MRLEFSALIPAPRDAVWALAQDPHRRADWDVRVGELVVEGGEPRAGARAILRLRTLGVHPMAEARYEVFDAPRESVVRVERVTPAVSPPAVLSWTFEDAGVGGTRVTLRLEIDLEEGLRARLTRRVVARDARRSLENLRRLAASGQASSPA